MLTLKLPAKTEKQLDAFCEQKNLSKSQVVKDAITMYLQQKQIAKTPYELGADLFGQEGSGQGDTSVTYKERVKQILNEKHTR